MPFKKEIIMIPKRKLDRMFNLKKVEEENENELPEKVELEKNDGIALFLAAFITFVPALLVIIGVIVLLVWLFIK